MLSAYLQNYDVSPVVRFSLWHRKSQWVPSSWSL